MTVDHIEQITHMLPHLRIGWANSLGYVTYPGGGEAWGGKILIFIIINYLIFKIIQEMALVTIYTVMALMA